MTGFMVGVAIGVALLAATRFIGGFIRHGMRCK